MSTASTSRGSRRKSSTSSSVSLGPLPAPDQLVAEQCRRSLRRFIREAWPLVEPTRPMQDNWHLQAIAEHLEAVSAGEIQRLIINVPPRNMKSLSVAVFWPAWEWLMHPEIQWLFASHSAGLAWRDARKSRRVMSSPAYRSWLSALDTSWEFTDDENLIQNFLNTAGGRRRSTGIGGEATGEGGDRVVIDDPHKLEEADSEAKREDAVEFATEVVPSRLNAVDSATVVIQQRVHELDVTGALIERSDDWTVLCLPMEYEPKHPLVWKADPRTRKGELLWPERFPADHVESELKSIGSYKYAGQYQQRPSPEEGGIIKRAWWRRYAAMGWPQLSEVIQSWDMTFKDKKGNDWVVGQVWGVNLANRFLLCQIRARLDFPATKRAVRDLSAWCDEHGLRADRKLVEDKANGPAVIADLRSKVSGLVPVEPEGGKEARAHSVAPQIESGNVYLPEGVIPSPVGYEQTRTEVFVEECAGFPNAAHDDQVDAMTQALNRLRAASGNTRKPRTV